MSRPPVSPCRRHAPARAVVALGAALGLVASAWAGAPAHRPPLYARLVHSLFPSDQPGYLPMAGSPPLRVGAVVAAVPISPPPVVLYGPPEPVPAGAASPSNVVPVSPPTAAESTPAPATTDRKAPPLRPDDFLPYFQPNDGRGTLADGFQFVPARPDLPSSQASFQQQ